MQSSAPFVSRDTLLAIAFCLLMFGVILRTYARQYARTQHFRRQHALHHHPVAEATTDTARQTPWLEKHFSKIANGVVLIGSVCLVTAFFLN